MRAESAVEPTRSENITVTWRRSARSSGCMLLRLSNGRERSGTGSNSERFVVGPAMIHHSKMARMQPTPTMQLSANRKAPAQNQASAFLRWTSLAMTTPIALC
jgi:adenylosuccinate lyase